MRFYDCSTYYHSVYNYPCKLLFEVDTSGDRNHVTIYELEKYKQEIKEDYSKIYRKL